MDITDEDRALLGRITTRDEAGRHFTRLYPAEWLARMEAAGYLHIHRPVHRATGIRYAPEYWSVTVAAEVATWFDDSGQLIH